MNCWCLLFVHRSNSSPNGYYLGSYYFHYDFFITERWLIGEFLENTVGTKRLKIQPRKVSFPRYNNFLLFFDFIEAILFFPHIFQDCSCRLLSLIPFHWVQVPSASQWHFTDTLVWIIQGNQSERDLIFEVLGPQGLKESMEVHAWMQHNLIELSSKFFLLRKWRLQNVPI